MDMQNTLETRLWTEKYRPRVPDELDCPVFMRSFLDSATRDGFPNLLLYGPPGTGKTTFALLLKPTLELNASDDRGIDMITNKVKKMANTVAPQVILLDECENLTKDAQTTCLRRILEDSPETRFIFCTNYYSKIIDPLKSRLLKLKFTLKESRALERIGKTEGMPYASEFYTNLFHKCGQDLRKCLNVLQGIKPLDAVDIDDVVGVVPGETILEFWSVVEKNYRSFVDRFLFEGYSVQQLIKQLATDLRLRSDFEKARFAIVLAEAECKSVQRCADEAVLVFLVLNLIAVREKQ